MKLTYNEYISQMQSFKQPPMSEEQFNIMQGINTDKCEPALQIRPKRDARKIDATLKNYEEME